MPARLSSPDPSPLTTNSTRCHFASPNCLVQHQAFPIARHPYASTAISRASAAAATSRSSNPSSSQVTPPNPICQSQRHPLQANNQSLCLFVCVKHAVQTDFGLCSRVEPAGRRSLLTNSSPSVLPNQTARSCRAVMGRAPCHPGGEEPSPEPCSIRLGCSWLSFNPCYFLNSTSPALSREFAK